MKSNTTLKIAAVIALILCVTMMSGCIDSDDIQTSADISAVPFMVTVIMDVPEGAPSYSITFTIDEDGIGEYCLYGLGEDVCASATWTQGSSDNEFILLDDAHETGDEVYIMISDDGKATLESDREDETLFGEWEKI